MFTFANAQLFMLQHPRLFSKERRHALLQKLLHEPHYDVGIYVSCIAERLFEELAPAFFAILEGDTIHMQLFMLQHKYKPRWICLDEDGALPDRSGKDPDIPPGYHLDDSGLILPDG